MTKLVPLGGEGMKKTREQLEAELSFAQRQRHYWSSEVARVETCLVCPKVGNEECPDDCPLK